MVLLDKKSGQERSYPRRAVLCLQLIVTLSFFLVISSAVSGSSAEFLVSGLENQVQSCKCGSSVQTFTITNIAQQDLTVIELQNGSELETVQQSVGVPLSFLITVDGLESSWYTLTEQSFIVQAGESKDVTLFLKVPCQVRENGKKFKLSIVSSRNERQEYLQELNIATCKSAEITPVSSAMFARPCTSSIFELKVKNVQNFEDMISIDAVPGNLGLDLSEKSVYLGPYETKSVYLYAKPSCEKYGTFKIEVTSTSKNTGTVQKIPLDLIVEKAYDFNVQVQDLNQKQTHTVNACMGLQAQAYIYIQNPQLFENTFKLKIQGPSWVFSDIQKVSIPAGQSVLIPVTINAPMFNLQNQQASQKLAGLHQVDIAIYTTKGDQQKKASFGVELQPCYLPFINLERQYALPQNVSTIQLDVVNGGTLAAAYEVKALGPAFLTLVSSEQIELAQGRNANLVLSVANQTGITAGSYPFKVLLKEKQTGLQYEYGSQIKVQGLSKTLLMVLFVVLGFLFVLLVIIILLVFARRKPKKNYEKVWEKYTDDEIARQRKEEKEQLEKAKEEKATAKKKEQEAKVQAKKEAAKRSQKDKESRKEKERKVPTAIIVLIVLLLALIAAGAVFLLGKYVPLTGLNQTNSSNQTLQLNASNQTAIPSVIPSPASSAKPTNTPTPTRTPIPTAALVANATALNGTNMSGLQSFGWSSISQAWNGYLPYVLVAVLVLAVILFVAWLSVRAGKKKKSASPIDPRIEKLVSKHRMETDDLRQEIKSLKKELSKKEMRVSKSKTERKESRKRSRETANYGWIWIVIIAGILIGLYLVWYSYDFALPTFNMTSGNEDINQTNSSMKTPVQNSSKSPSKSPLKEAPIINAAVNGTNATINPAGSPTPTPFDFSGFNCTISLERNETMVVDLGQFFVDPDGDNLSFKIDKNAQNVTAQINGTKITLVTSAYFVGVNKLGISASDGKEGPATEGEITICVMPNKGNSWLKNVWNAITLYLDYILIGVGLLVLLIIILTYAQKSNAK